MEDAAGAAGGGIAFLFTLVIQIGFYVFFAYCIKLIADKTGHRENSWWAWIPIIQVLLLLQVAEKPLWWLVLMFIPLVNIVIAIIVMMAVAEKRGKPSWIGILMIVPLVNIVVLPYLAFAD